MFILFVNKIKCSSLFFTSYLASPRSTLGHYGGGSLTHHMLIPAFSEFRIEVRQEPQKD